MKSSLIDRLKSQPHVKVWTTKGATSELLALVERDYRIQFPDDYRELMLSVGNLGVTGAKSQIQLGLKDTYTHLGDAVFEKRIPGMVVIGDDGGGRIYYYDPEDRLGKGRFAVFLVPLSSLTLEDTFFVGKSVTEVIERVSAGEDFDTFPRLGANGA